MQNGTENESIQLKELLKNTNFVAHWLHSAFYLASSNIIQFALSLFVLDMTGSSVAFASLLSIVIIPRLIFTPFSGVTGDRYNRVTILKLTSFFAVVIVISFFLAIKFYFDFSLFSIYVLVITLEIGEIFHGTASGAIIPEIVSKEHLNEAASLRVFQRGLTGALSSAIGGIIYEFFGIYNSLLFTSVLFTLSFIALFFLNYKSKINKIVKKQSYFKDIKDSILFIAKDPFLRNYVFYPGSIVFFFASEYMVTTYVMKSLFHFSGTMIGVYRAIYSIVYISIPILLMKQIKKRPTKRLLWVLPFCLSFAIACLGTSVFLGLQNITNLMVVFILIIVFDCISVGLMGPLHVSIQVFKQKNIPKEYYGRIISVMALLGTISMPIGQFVYGFLINKTPPWIAYVVSSVMILAVSIWGKKSFDRKD